MRKRADERSGPERGAAVPQGSPVELRGAAILMAAAVVALAPVAAAVKWKSSERDVPVATDHGLAVSATVAEVVYKTAPFEIVVVVDNPTDRIDPGRYRLLVYFSYELGANTSPPPLIDDPASNGPRADLSLWELQSVWWHLAIEVREAET